MKRNVCRIIGILLAALMVAAMIPMTALAAEDEQYDLWVGGERFTAAQNSFGFGEGTASFDAATSTLTLSKAAVTTAYEYSERAFAVVYSKLDNLNIVLEGENEIKDSEGKGACGIYTTGSLGIKGSGSLKISSVYNGMHIGFDSLGFDGTDVSVTSSSTGIWAAKDININKSTLKVTAEGNFANAVISDIAGTVTVNESNVDFSSKRAALKLGDGDTDASVHALVMNSGELNLNSEKDYAVMVWNYRDPETGATSTNGTITFNGGNMNVYSANGGTNLPNEKVIIADGMGFSEGSSLSDSGFVILGKYDPITKYDLWVDGKQFTDKMTAISCGDGTATFDAETSTLTLDNATVASAYEYKERAFALIYSELDKLNIVVKGESKLTDGEGKSAEAVVSAGGNVTVKGGKLNISGVYIGFRVGSSDKGSLAFDGSKLALTSSSTGLWVAKDISFNNTTASIVSEGNFSNAVVSNIAGTMTITNSDVEISSKRSAVHFGAGDNDASAHALVLNAGKLSITSTRDYGVMFWNYRDPESGETKNNGTMTFKNGIAEFHTASGSSNLPEESVTVSKDMYRTVGASVSDSELVLKSRSYLKLEPVTEIPATCTDDGVKAHFAEGEAKFADKDGKKPVTDEQLVIAALGHDWGDPEYKLFVVNDELDQDFYATATVTCKRDINHSVSETVKMVSTEVRKANCENDGELRYDAPFTNELFATQSETLTVPKLGHNLKYTNPVPATIGADGCEGYYKCESCGKIFRDAEAAEEVGDVSALTVPAPALVKLSKAEFVYDGKAKKPTVIAVDKNGETIPADFYDVNYPSGRKNVGTYKVTVTFKERYSGAVTPSFTVLPKSTTIKKLTAGKKKLTVSFKKQTAQISGYRIQYSLKSSFNSAKTITVKPSKTTATISKLKSGKKYYVRIQTYKTVSGKKYYSSWSKALSKKTK